MRASDLMKDPYYAGMIFAIEGHLHDYDVRVETDEDVKLKDSDIKSAIRKAMGLLRGAGTLKPPKDQQDRLKGALAIELVGVYESKAMPEGSSRADFINALLAVEDSLKTRREMGGHPRGYLEFLGGFVAESRGNQPDQAGPGIDQ
jgi:hypothetical protein